MLTYHKLYANIATIERFDNLMPSPSHSPESERPLTESEIEERVAAIMGSNATANTMREEIRNSSDPDQPNFGEAGVFHLPTVEDLVDQLDSARGPDTIEDDESGTLWKELDKYDQGPA